MKNQGREIDHVAICKAQGLNLNSAPNIRNSKQSLSIAIKTNYILMLTRAIVAHRLYAPKRFGFLGLPSGFILSGLQGFWLGFIL